MANGTSLGVGVAALGAIYECNSLTYVAAVNKCDFVRTHCGSVAHLVNYLELRYCVCGPDCAWEVVDTCLIIWLVLLISLVDSTAGMFLVKPATALSAVVKLDKTAMRITVVALANGAAAMFTGIAGILRVDDFTLVVSIFVGSMLFVSTVVVGVVLIAAERRGGVVVSMWMLVRGAPRGRAPLCNSWELTHVHTKQMRWLRSCWADSSRMRLARGA